MTGICEIDTERVAKVPLEFKDDLTPQGLIFSGRLYVIACGAGGGGASSYGGAGGIVAGLLKRQTNVTVIVGRGGYIPSK